MKKLIVLVGLCLSLSVLAQEQLLEPAWKTKGRDFFSSFVGTNMSEKMFGPVPQPEVVEVKLPVIPKQVKKSTDVTNYTKLTKEATEYERLPATRKREFDYKFLKELFQVTRKSEAKDEDLATWLNTLDQGGSREGIYQALVLDEVYAALENMEEKPSNQLLDFSVKLSQRFFNQPYKKESLMPLNLFSLKRIMTEKALDLMEHYEVNNLDHLYQWYAVLSFELARDYAPLLKSPIRQDPRLEFHQEWAKSMPIQHIKSEVIIKIHAVMNGLQLLEP
ncbi:MAG: hypothetical protein H0V66_03980 [Bdellovibrionales bacterium]|nr:hypothetical protein [Bdellovibrionales bacterium]